MTTKQKHISEILEKMYQISHKADEEANKAWEKLDSDIDDPLTNFTRKVGIQIGINRCLSELFRLWDEASEDEDK